MSQVIKAIPAENYIINPFLTHKTQTYEFTYLSGSGPAQVTLDLAVAPPTVVSWAFDANTAPVNTSGIYEETLYSSVRHIFYGSASYFNFGLPLAAPSGTLAVFSIAQRAFGDKIAPGTVTIKNTTNNITFTDDGSGSLKSASSGSHIFGNVFYQLGVMVLPFAALGLTTGSGVFVEFDATHTIYEHQIVCTMDPGEFNYSFNPSIKATSSFDGDGVKVMDKIASGTLSPYLTTVGLFTHEGELVATAKFPRALKRAPETQQTVIVRFDV